MNDSNFDQGPRNFFQAAPAPIRPLIVTMVRRKVRQSLRAHGMGRHAPAEVAAQATRSIDAMAAYLSRKAFFMGAEPVGVDAAVFSFVAGALCPTFETPIRSAAGRHDNLKRYVGRMTARFYRTSARSPAAKLQREKRQRDSGDGCPRAPNRGFSSFARRGAGGRRRRAMTL
jgi:glutathione S-transferase